MEFSPLESHCAVSALLLRNVTKALPAGINRDVVMYDPFHLYTVDAFIERVLAYAHGNGEDTGSILEIPEEAVPLITRLVRTSDGIYSIVPETFPTTMLEKTVHMATLMGSLCYDILNGEKINAESSPLDD